MKTQNTFRSEESPIIIGGGGGSGTRVVAEIVKQLGFYIGDDLNHANDNLWFTLIFKRPRWFHRMLASGESHDIYQAIRIFESIMTKSRKLSLREEYFLLKAATSMSLTGHDHLKSGQGYWPFFRLKTAFSTQPETGRKHWGWKEPNAHIYIEHLAKYFPKARYIHVVRNGLDMAFSKNQAQLYNWGWLFNISPPNPSNSLPPLSLKYWIASNERAITLGKDNFLDRFFLVDFDALCHSPHEQIPALLDFIGYDKNQEVINNLSKIPRKPKTIGRHKNHDLSIFSDEDLRKSTEIALAWKHTNSKSVSKASIK